MKLANEFYFYYPGDTISILYKAYEGSSDDKYRIEWMCDIYNAIKSTEYEKGIVEENLLNKIWILCDKNGNNSDEKPLEIVEKTYTVQFYDMILERTITRTYEFKSELTSLVKELISNELICDIVAWENVKKELSVEEL